jgi:hypothetical protein
MGVLGEIRKLGFFEILSYLLVFVGSACPGYLVVLLFLPQLFSSLDFLKLVFLSVSLTLPLIVVNLFFIAVVFFDRKTDNPMTVLAVSALNSAAALYGGLAAAYLLDLRFRPFAVVVLAVNGAMIVILNLSGNLERPKKGEPKAQVPKEDD